MSDAFSSTGDGAIFSLPQIRHLLRVEFARAQRYSYPVSLVLIDFRPLRDELGDEGFDGLAPNLVTRLRELVRTSDYVGRLAQDRVLVLLPHTESGGTRRLAERAVEALSVDGGGRGARPTLGLASFEEGSILFFDALLEAAEESLDAAERGAVGELKVL